MTRNELLARMGLTEKQLMELLHKFRHFYKSLDPKQKSVVKHSLPTLEAAAKSFGPDVTVDDLHELFGTDETDGPFGSNVAENQPNQGGNQTGSGTGTNK